MLKEIEDITQKWKQIKSLLEGCKNMFSNRIGDCSCMQDNPCRQCEMERSLTHKIDEILL